MKLRPKATAKQQEDLPSALAQAIDHLRHERVDEAEPALLAILKLFEKKQRGETLTADEEKFLDEAKARHKAREGGGGQDGGKLHAIKEKMDRGEKLTDEEQKIVDEFQKRKAAGGGEAGGGADMQRAKQIHEKKQRGETLTEEEQKILDEAMRRRGEK